MNLTKFGPPTTDQRERIATQLELLARRVRAGTNLNGLEFREASVEIDNEHASPFSSNLAESVPDGLMGQMVAVTTVWRRQP